MLYTIAGAGVGLVVAVVGGKLLNVGGSHGSSGGYGGELPFIFLMLTGILVGGGVGFGYGLNAFQNGTYFNFLK